MTAVQWLEKQYLLTNGKLVCQDFEYAEKLEKQEIIDAHKNGEYLIPHSENAEQYYNKTYKKD
jgi:hypothetical protein